MIFSKFIEISHNIHNPGLHHFPYLRKVLVFLWRQAPFSLSTPSNHCSASILSICLFWVFYFILFIILFYEIERESAHMHMHKQERGGAEGEGARES